MDNERTLTNNKATQAFRMAAQTMWQNKGSLGHLYRRLSAQKGSKKAKHQGSCKKTGGNILSHGQKQNRV